jgi:hypothetical protein
MTYNGITKRDKELILSSYSMTARFRDFNEHHDSLMDINHKMGVEVGIAVE